MGNYRNYGRSNGRRMVSEAWNPSSYNKIERALEQILSIYNSLGQVSPEVESAFKNLYETLEGSANGSASPAEPARQRMGGSVMGGFQHSDNGGIGAGAGFGGGASTGSFTDRSNGVTLTPRDIQVGGDGIATISTNFLAQFFSGEPRAVNTGRRGDPNSTPIKELVPMVQESLANGFCAFKYVKQDGSLRPAVGTTNQELINFVMNGNAPANDKNEGGRAIAYFDLQRMEWRSFIYYNLREVY